MKTFLKEDQMDKITTIEDLKVYLEKEIKAIEKKYRSWPDLRHDIKMYNKGWTNAFEDLLGRC